jgi:hypothetical protein
MLILPTLKDVEQGADAYLECHVRSKKKPSGLQDAAIREFYDLCDTFSDNELHFTVFAFLAAGDTRAALDFFRAKIEECQPDQDELDDRAWGEAADRGNDERGK